MCVWRKNKAKKDSKGQAKEKGGQEGKAPRIFINRSTQVQLKEGKGTVLNERRKERRTRKGTKKKGQVDKDGQGKDWFAGSVCSVLLLLLLLLLMLMLFLV